MPIGHAGTVFRMSQLGHSPIPPDYNWIPTPLRFPPDYNHAFLQRMNITCPNRHWSHKENDFYFNQRGREMRFGVIWFPPFQFVNSSISHVPWRSSHGMNPFERQVEFTILNIVTGITSSFSNNCSLAHFETSNQTCFHHHMGTMLLILKFKTKKRTNSLMDYIHIWNWN